MASTHLLQFRRFAQYNAWFNGRIYELAGGLDEEARRRDMGAFFGSIHATLGHVLLGDRMWLGRFARPLPENSFAFDSLRDAELVYRIDSLADELFPSWGDLCEARSATDEVLRRFVRELTPELLAADLHYENSKGIPFRNPVWHVVAHLFNHQTHHRGQVTTLLHQHAIDPGMTDFILTAMLPADDP